MVGSSSLCIEALISLWIEPMFPLEQFIFCWPLPHVAGSPDRGVLSASLTSTRPSDLPRLVSLSGPTGFRLNLMDLPCSHEILWLHAGGTNPGSISGRLPCRIQSFCLPRNGIGSATSTTIDFGAILPFTDVPACILPVSASQWPLPDITQDLV